MADGRGGGEVKSVQFDELVGAHALDGVEMGVTRLPDASEDSNLIRFRLDGVVYEAIEYPDDGYRSCMKDLYVSESAITNVFEPVAVDVAIDNGGPERSNCTLSFTDTANGQVILRVGTDNSDDYYPWFVAEWMPQFMAVNQ